MAAVKYSLVTIMLVLIGLVAHTQMAAAQNCSAGLASLSVCAPFVVPGITEGPPTSECCSALTAVDHSCLCNTIDIISRLPTTCKLPPVSCST